MVSLQSLPGEDDQCLWEDPPENKGKDGKTNDMDTLTKQRTCVDSLFLFDWLLDLNGFWDIHCRDLDCPLFIASSFMMYHQEGMGTYDCQPSLILLHDHQT